MNDIQAISPDAIRPEFIDKKNIISTRELNKLEKKRGRCEITLLARAALFFNQKDYQKANYFFNKSLEFKYTDDALAAILKIAKEENRLASVIPTFHKFEKSQSTNSKFFQFFGYTLYELEKYDEAFEILKKVEQITNKSEPINRNLILKCLTRSEKHQELLEVSNEYISAGFLEETTVEAYLKACVSLSKFDQALKFLEGTNFDWQQYSRVTAYASIIYYSAKSDLDKSVLLGEKALSLEPDNVQIRWNLALSQLRNGKIRDGINNYKCRFDWDDFPSPRRIFNTPKWDETVPGDSRIMIWTEQGIGDELLFASALEDFKRVYPNLVVETQRKTNEVYKTSFPNIEFRETSYKLDLTTELEDFDFQIPMGDVFLWYLEKNLDRLENGGSLLKKGYLKPDLLRKEYWRSKLKETSPRPKVGICWTSSVTKDNRAAEHTRLEQWKEMLIRSECDFVSLQYNFDYEDLTTKYDIPKSTFIDTGYLDQFDDLEGAVALISNLDLVITSGASPYILAGSLGIETWVYSKPSAFVFGRKEKFCSHPILKNIKYYRSDNPSTDENLVNEFSSKLGVFIKNFENSK